MSAVDALTGGLDVLNTGGDLVPCRAPRSAHRWTSEAASDRAWAAAQCLDLRCPLLVACRAAADELGATVGVWAGRDRTPRQGRPPTVGGRRRRGGPAEVVPPVGALLVPPAQARALDPADFRGRGRRGHDPIRTTGKTR